MRLGRWLVPLLWSAVRSDAITLQYWGRTRYPAYVRFFTSRRDFPLFSPSRPVAGHRTPRRMVWRLALSGLFYGVLALSLPDLASSAVGEVMGSLYLISLRSGASPVLSRAETCPLAPLTPPASQFNERFTLDDSDVDDDNSLLTFRAHFLPPAPVCRGSTVQCLPTSGHSTTYSF